MTQQPGSERRRRNARLVMAGAAFELDLTVETPERLPFPEARMEVADRPVGEVLHRRLAAFRRRLVGLS